MLVSNLRRRRDDSMQDVQIIPRTCLLPAPPQPTTERGRRHATGRVDERDAQTP